MKGHIQRAAVIFFWVLVLAFAVRLVYQLERRFIPSWYDLSPGMDEYNYDRLAYSMVKGRHFYPGLIYSLPAYPVFLFSVYLLLGRSLAWIRFLQLLMGATSCGLTYLLGRRVLGARTGLLAAVIMAFYGPALFYESLLVPASLALFFSLLTLFWWTRLPVCRQLNGWLLGGIFLGLSTLTSAVNLLFALILMVFWIPLRDEGFKVFPVRQKETAVALGILLVLLPFCARNALLARALIPMTAHGGVNFYIGNNPEANGGFKTPLFLTPSATGIIKDSHRRAEELSGRKLTPGEVSGYWMRRGLNYVIAHPRAILRLWLNKIRMVFSSGEYHDIGTCSGGSEPRFKLLGLPLVEFSWLSPWALLGFFLCLRRGRLVSLLHIFLAAHILGMLFFFHQARGRLPMIPVFSLLAAESVGQFIDLFQEKHFKLILLRVTVLIAFSLLVYGQPRFEMRSETNLLITAAQQEIGQTDYSGALAKVERALEINPLLGGAYVVLGDIYTAQGDIGKALASYARAKIQNPTDPTPSLQLGALLLASGEKEAAIREVRRALALDPLSWKARSLLARICYERGESAKEIREYRAVLRLNPNSVSDRNDLGAAYAQSGDLPAAIRQWLRALKTDPASPQVKVNLQTAMSQL